MTLPDGYTGTDKMKMAEREGASLFEQQAE
jgi:hypothetical protein